MRELWWVMEDTFIKTRKITYDCFVFPSSEQQKGKSLESFYGRLIEQAENCCLGDEESTIVGDTFIFDLIDLETQKNILKRQCRQQKRLKLPYI